MGDLMKLKLRCDPFSIQLIKGQLDRCKYIIRHEVKKEKRNSKLMRALTSNVC